MNQVWTDLLLPVGKILVQIQIEDSMNRSKEWNKNGILEDDY